MVVRTVKLVVVGERYHVTCPIFWPLTKQQLSDKWKYSFLFHLFFFHFFNSIFQQIQLLLTTHTLSHSIYLFYLSHTHRHTHTRACSCNYSCTHTYTRTYAHTHKHINTHTHTLARTHARTYNIYIYIYVENYVLRLNFLLKKEVLFITRDVFETLFLGWNFDLIALDRSKQSFALV